MAWSFSVLILTLNEERDLPRCLGSVAACDDIVVLDSGSADRTAELARSAGARMFVRPFDTFAGQRNFAQREIAFRHPWVFHLDADEQMTAELAAECSAAASRPDLDGFWAAPRMLFHGRWIPHFTDYPAWQARFVRAPQFEFVDAGHGQRESPAMRLGRLGSPYLHDLSSDSEAEWLGKHHRYARAEAREWMAENARHGGNSFGRDLGRLFAADRLLRRRALKRLSHALPLRSASRFVYQYILRRGFLDGRPGLRYCRLLAQYEGFVADELRRLRKGNRTPSL
jgi:glycosyltransferase involved in cell wall biosynthesis